MQALERITARRGELDAHAEELTKQLQEVQAEREELVIAERVLNRLTEQDRAEAEDAAAVTPTPARVTLVGEELGFEVAVRGKLEPLRAKMTKLAHRGWLHKRGDGRFTARS
ncbi:hypothetical protein [Streptomyces sp. NPDC003247]|uniref:hypothetical protein n=1 Tax=Streptomyces sp. NPDC003247 TaxID=3364677 RepID=UPI0036838DCD